MSVDEYSGIGASLLNQIDRHIINWRSVHFDKALKVIFKLKRCGEPVTTMLGCLEARVMC